MTVNDYVYNITKSVSHYMYMYISLVQKHLPLEVYLIFFLVPYELLSKGQDMADLINNSETCIPGTQTTQGKQYSRETKIWSL